MLKRVLQEDLRQYNNVLISKSEIDCSSNFDFKIKIYTVKIQTTFILHDHFRVILRSHTSTIKQFYTLRN